jgi:hypothetical protein
MPASRLPCLLAVRGFHACLLFEASMPASRLPCLLFKASMPACCSRLPCLLQGLPSVTVVPHALFSDGLPTLDPACCRRCRQPRLPGSPGVHLCPHCVLRGLVLLPGKPFAGISRLLRLPISIHVLLCVFWWLGGLRWLTSPDRDPSPTIISYIPAGCGW